MRCGLKLTRNELLQNDRLKNKRRMFQMTNSPEFIFQCFVHCRFKISMTLQECPDATKCISFFIVPDCNKTVFCREISGSSFKKWSMKINSTLGVLCTRHSVTTLNRSVHLTFLNCNGTMCSPQLNTNDSLFCDTLYAFHGIQKLIFIIEAHCVVFELRSESLCMRCRFLLSFEGYFFYGSHPVVWQL